ncbi:unnamed protein product [Schistocephalus solidus]|uniref:C2H2-type domain-containing protein n=1 Tax=Schistocephalus solidus TaxID=70667 RepID=A0A183SDJ9_SCHSO|nr:unnamed protein product [Schistocephalus solidus]
MRRVGPSWPFWTAKYDFARSADISAATTPSVVLDGVCEILGCSEHPRVLQSDFRRRYQQPGESINDFQQALQLFGRRAQKALNTRVLRQLVAEVRDHQIRKILALAREEEFLQATCGQPPRSLFGVIAVLPHSSNEAATQTPWQSCSRGSSPWLNNCRWPRNRRTNRPQAHRTIEASDAAPGPNDDTTCLIRHKERPYSEEFSVHFNRLKPGYNVGENADHSEMHASPSHRDNNQLFEHYLEVPAEGRYALPKVFNNEQQIETLVEDGDWAGTFVYGLQIHLNLVLPEVVVNEHRQLILLSPTIIETTSQCSARVTLTTITATTTTTISDGNSLLKCPHCDRTFTSRIGLVGHLRIHRTETDEPVPGTPTHSRDRHLPCPHCHRVFTHRMGLFSHMRIHNSGIHRNADNTDTPYTPSAPAILTATPLS